MKTLLLTNHLRPGGIPFYCLLLSQHLKAWGVEVYVASGGGGWESELKAWGVKHFRLPLDTSAELNPGAIYSYFRLRRIVKEFGIDVVHDQSRVTQVIGFLLAKYDGVRRVSTCHGFFKRRFFRKLFPLWPKNVIAISEGVRQHLQNDWGLEAGRVHLIPHGLPVTPEVFSEETKQRARKDFSLPPNAFVIGALGRFSPVKGYDILIKAMQEIIAEDFEPHLVLVGEGPEEARLKELAERFSMGSRVRFVDAYKNKDNFFEALDLFCAPSRQEGLGLSILEAMAHKRAVVASRVGGIPDLVTHNKTGFLVSPEDASGFAQGIRTLAKDAVLRQTLAENARAFIQTQFRLETMMERTRALYEEVMR